MKRREFIASGAGALVTVTGWSLADRQNLAEHVLAEVE